MDSGLCHYGFVEISRRETTIRPDSFDQSSVADSSRRTIPSPVLGGLALFGSLFTVLWNLGSYPLLQPDEGRNAEIAREMLESGNWLIPTYNGLAYLDKPAFFFKTVALCLGLFGQSEASARLPSAFFGLATLALIYTVCRRHYGRKTAAVAVLVITTSPLFIGFSRFVIFDMTLAFFVSAAILACFSASEAEGQYRSWLYAVAAACAGVATLVKGPVGFIVPTLVTALYHAWGGQRGWWREAFAWRNLAIFLVVVVPWFLGVSLYHPDFPYYGLIKESLHRFTTDEFRRTAPLYYYAVVIGLCFSPWSLLLPESVAVAWRERYSWHHVDRLFAVWALAVVVFFSLSQSKLPGYILTAVIALGVLVARLLVQSVESGGDSPVARIVWRGSLIFGIAASLAAILCLLPSLAPEILDVLPPRISAYLRDLASAFLWMGCLLAVSATIAFIGFARRDARFTGVALLLYALLLVPILTAHMDQYAEHRAANSLAQRIPPLSQDTTLACYRCYPNGLSFYSQRYVTIISARDGYELQSNYIRFTLSNAPNWPGSMVREGDFGSWLATRDRPVFLLVKAGDLENLRARLADRDVAFAMLTADFSGTLLQPRRKY